jgi:hypothetical protein
MIWAMSLRERWRDCRSADASPHAGPSGAASPLASAPSLAAIAFLTLCCIPVSAEAAPSLAWVFPAGGQRGTTVTMTVAGDNLADVSGLFATGTGLKAQVLPASEALPPPLDEAKPGAKPKAPDAKKFRELRVAIAPDAPLGRQEIRVFDRSGVSNARYFQVGDQPEIVEREPNDDSTGQPVEIPVVVNGRIQQDTDVDIYSFHGKKGQRIVGEIYGERVLGTIGEDSWLKGYLELRDNAGHVLAANEGYYHWDPLIEYTLPADGDYSFLSRELTYRGSPSAVYRLAIGALPRATALFPSGGRRGSTAGIAFVGDNLGPQPALQVKIPADAPLGALDERLQTAAGWTNALPFEVGDLPEVRELEPNDDWQHAMPVTPPVTINGRLDRPGDVDNYRFKLAKGQRLVLEVLADRSGSPMDSFLRLLDSDGQAIQENDDGIRERDGDVRSRDSRIERTFDSGGGFIAQVRDLDQRGGDSFVYRLTLAPPRPDFALTATPDSPAIGAGGTAVLDLSLNRSDGFDGDVAVQVADLPPGFTATSAVIRKGQEKGRLTVTAAESLPVQALRLHVAGGATIDGQRERRLAAATATYNIQGTAFTRELIGPVAGIGAPAPFALAIEPAVLTLKDGEGATLKVRARRQPEVSGEIEIKFPDLPAGVTAAPAKIPSGASEAAVELKVDPDAAAADVNLVASGETKVGESTVTAPSPAFALSVTELPGFSVTVEPKELTAALESQPEVSFTVKAERRGGFDAPIDLQWSIPSARLTMPAGHIEAGKSEAKISLKIPKELRAGTVDLKLIASAPVAGATRTRESEVKLTLTAAKPGGK